MASQAPRHREQEQSIKERQQRLFEEDEPKPEVPAGPPRRPFGEYLNTTPAAPLSAGTKAALWAVGAVVMLLLVAALLKGGG